MRSSLRWNASRLAAAVFFCLAFVLAGGLAGPSPCRADRPPTNSELVGRALRGATDSLLHGLPLETDVPLVIVPAGGQSGEWALENEIAGELQKRVKHVSFHGALTDTVPGVESHSDSVRNSRRRMHAGVDTLVDARPLDPTANVLEYRIASLGVRYAQVHKSRIFGAAEVDRVATVSLGVRLLSPWPHHLLASAQSSGEARDRVPRDRLTELEDQLYQFPHPELPSKDLSRVLEPAIVVGLVTGLVFLFYTNRN